MKIDMKGPLDSGSVMNELLDKTGILEVFNDICDLTMNPITLKIKLRQKKWDVQRIYGDTFLNEPGCLAITTKHYINLFIRLPGNIHNSEIKVLFNQLEDTEKDFIVTILYTILYYSEDKTKLFLRDFIKYLHDSSTCMYKDNNTTTNHASTD